MRGFFGGVIVGFVILTAAAAVLSLLTPLPQRPDVESRAPAEVNDASQAAEDSGVGPVGRDADLVEAAPIAPGSTAPASDDLAPLDNADTEPADKPVVGGATGALTSGTAMPAAPEVAVETDTPVTPQAQTDGPSAPASDDSVSISTDPAQPAPPVVSDAGSGFGAPQVDETAPEVGTGSAADSSPDSDGGSMAQPGSGNATGTGPQVSTDPGPAATTPQSADNTGGDITTAGTAPVPEVSAVPQQPSGDTGPETTPDAASDPANPPRVAGLPQVTGAPDASEPRTRPGTPVVPLTERDGGDASALGAGTPEETAETGAGSDEPRLKRFAAPFDAPEGKPLMSILLIDTEGSIGAEALGEFPYPLSFAVDPADPKAAEKMAQYRDAGFEVALLANLPAAATAQDAEVSMAVWLETMSEAVAIVEGTGSGIQGNRGLSDQVTAIAGSEGLGLVTQSNGLNTVQKLAARAGVPSAVVFRDFDGAGQTPTVMRRFLDQAAFRAGQEGAVIMLGRVQPDTISALLLWGLQDRAQRVALSPLSAVLLREEAAQ